MKLTLCIIAAVLVIASIVCLIIYRSEKFTPKTRDILCGIGCFLLIFSYLLVSFAFDFLT